MGSMGFFAITLDDFEDFLRNEFLIKAKVSMMPHLGGILIRDQQSPCFVKVIPLDK